MFKYIKNTETKTSIWYENWGWI